MVVGVGWKARVEQVVDGEVRIKAAPLPSFEGSHQDTVKGSVE